MITNLEVWFLTLSLAASTLLGSVPSVICTKEPQISEAIKIYSQDLPSPELVSQEILCWKLCYENMPADKRSTTAAAAIKECNQFIFQMAEHYCSWFVLYLSLHVSVNGVPAQWDP